MKKLIPIFVFLIGSVVSAQVSKDGLKTDVDIFPEEQIALFLNSKILLAGESLQYKITVSHQSSDLKDFSKLAYVSLRNPLDSIIFTHKLRLTNGSAAGDFFIPAELHTGIYTLIGYTNLSRNATAKGVEQKTVPIINTFQASRSQRKAMDTVKVDFIDMGAIIFSSEQEEVINIETDQQEYGLRDRVEINIESLQKETANFLLSVRKVSPAETEYNFQIRKSKSAAGIFYLPEVRGEIISGTVMTTVDSLPVADKEVSLTIPGKDFIFKMAKTNRDGKFIFSVNENYISDKSIVQVVETVENRNNYILLMDNKDISLHNSPEVYLKLDAGLKSWLQERSVQIQVDNSYYENKKDSLIPIVRHPVFYGNLGVVYNLDDYTRFPTVRETFIEVIKLAAIRGTGKESRFLVYNEYDPKGVAQFNKIPPLVLMDGILIQNSKDLIDFNPMEIKSIRIINTPYRYGPELYSGIIAVETVKTGVSPSNLSFINEIDLSSPIQEKKYFSPKYTSPNSLERIPDFRVQLLWEPELILSGKEKISTSLYTSDVPGVYKISIEGLNADGIRVQTHKYFSVIAN